MTIIGLIALKIAWDFVGKLYDIGIISVKISGYIIHWIIRLVVFIVIFYFCNILMWLTKFIYTYRSIVLLVIVILGIIIVIFKIVKYVNKVRSKK